MPWFLSIPAWLVVGACSGEPEQEGSEDGASSDSGDSSGRGEAGTETSGDTTEDSGDSVGGECKVWEPDDCNSPDLKCMPWSEQPDRIPDASKCCDLSSNPVSLGDPCTVQDYDGSCLDDCPANTMCVVDDLDSLTGYCQVFCDINNDDSCAGNEICKPFFEMIEAVETVPLCMAACDPLLQDCESKDRPGWSCLPEGASSPSFLCMPPFTSSPKLEYDPCLLANDCAVGLACIPASEVFGCENAFNCCTRYCDLSEPDPCEMGNECIDLQSDVPGLENVGICASPE